MKNSALVGLLVLLLLALGAVGSIYKDSRPKLTVKAESIPVYTITTDNRETRSGEPVTCFVLRIDGQPIGLSCVLDRPPVQFVPNFEDVQPEPGASW